MKKLISILLLAAVLLGAAGCSNANLNRFHSFIPNASEAELSGYSNLENSNGFMEITSDHVLSSLGSKDITAYVLMGSTNCHYCQDAIVEVQKQALANNQTVYYLSMDKIETEEKYNQLIEALSPILEKNPEGEPVLYMPHLFKIVEGELVDGHLGFGNGYDYSDVFANKPQEER